MPRVLIGAVFMMAFASCATDDESMSSTSVGVLDSVQPSAAETPTQISSSPPVSVPHSSGAAPNGSHSSAVSLIEVTSDCGPTDGNWVRGTLMSSDAQSVFAQLSVDGVTYGRSGIVALAAGVETTIGFDPQRPQEAFGKVGRFEVIGAETLAVLTSADVLLKIPDGVSCG